MKNTNDDNPISPENKIEGILGHKIISEYDLKKRSFNNIKKYKIKWVGQSEPTWERESKLEKYKKIVDNYKKLYENKGIKKISSNKEDSTSLYSECYMRFDESIISPNEMNNKRILDNKIINIEESSSEIIENGNESSNSEKNTNSNKDKKNLSERKKNSLKLFNSKYSKFGPSFKDVLNAGKNQEIKEKSLDKNLLNKKRKNTGKNSTKNLNNSDSLKKIYQIIVPSNKDENISIIYKRKNKEKQIIIKELSNSENVQKEGLLKCYENIIKTNINEISKDELITFYEQIIKRYFAGNTFNFD